jgi:hypothetical protein
MKLKSTAWIFCVAMACFGMFTSSAVAQQRIEVAAGQLAAPTLPIVINRDTTIRWDKPVAEGGPLGFIVSITTRTSVIYGPIATFPTACLIRTFVITANDDTGEIVDISEGPSQLVGGPC